MTRYVNTTHDWSAGVDHVHLRSVRASPDRYAPGGADHLVLEVLAYAADEGESRGEVARVDVSLSDDGTVTIADDGRGTDTRIDEEGAVLKKPLMATKDLRFFDGDHGVLLTDGHPRRGMSVVAALTSRLVHTNRRINGSWRQTYAHGVPTTGLEAVPDDGTHGTTVEFVPDAELVRPAVPDLDTLRVIVSGLSHLNVRFDRGR